VSGDEGQPGIALEGNALGKAGEDFALCEKHAQLLSCGALQFRESVRFGHVVVSESISKSRTCCRICLRRATISCGSAVRRTRT
jgi:hypothetical protein